MTHPCTAVRGHRDKHVGEGDVNVTSMYLIKHADITYVHVCYSEGQFRSVNIDDTLSTLL